MAIHLFLTGGDIVPRSASASNIAITELSRFVVADGFNFERKSTSICGQLSQGLCDGSVLLSKGPTPLE